MLTRRMVLLLPLGAAACVGDEVSSDSFAVPSYRYLTPLRLSVATIEVDDRAPPPPGDTLAGLAPLRPDDALRQMATDRLVAVGMAGRAVFVIDQASLRRVRGGIEGLMAVHLDIYAGASGDRSGFAEARVARRSSSGTDDDPRAALYQFVTQMMTDMNVEFEYQVKRSLKDWLQVSDGVAPPPPPVATQDLPSPTGRPPLSPPVPAGPLPAGSDPLLPPLSY